MKRKAISILMIFCFLMSGCSRGNTAEDTRSKTADDEKPVVSEEPEATAEVTPEADSELILDYSDHTDPDEAMYKTQLNDLSKLKDGKPLLAAKEPTAVWNREFTGFTKVDNFGYDVRSMDTSKGDLSQVDDLNYISFNSDTIWPDKLPGGFDPEKILEYNKNPGLGIRALQENGIDGSGIGIAIIDQALLLDHEQYKDNLMFYEKIHCSDQEAQMHGPAVASIAVGKTVGVAPGAKLYYIADTYGHYTDTSFDFDASILADSILRVLDINKNLPENEKIRVISISRGYTTTDKGYEELTAAIDKANEDNIFVITTSPENYYHFNLFGMNRDYMKDPDDFNSYLPAAWIASDFYSNPDRFKNDILVPMGSRTYAACTGTDKYEIERDGGLSWAVPWFAGFYALCCQVKPDITPEDFLAVVNATAVTTEITHNDKTYKFGKIVNPAEVIKQLQK